MTETLNLVCEEGVSITGRPVEGGWSSSDVTSAQGVEPLSGLSTLQLFQGSSVPRVHE
jgi:hypothetical protein